MGHLLFSCRLLLLCLWRRLTTVLLRPLARQVALLFLLFLLVFLAHPFIGTAQFEGLRIRVRQRRAYLFSLPAFWGSCAGPPVDSLLLLLSGPLALLLLLLFLTHLFVGTAQFEGLRVRVRQRRAHTCLFAGFLGVLRRLTPSY